MPRVTGRCGDLSPIESAGGDRGMPAGIIMWRRVARVDKYYVRNRPAGQDFCLILDINCVRRRRKSLIFNGGLDTIYVRHQLWCGT